MGLPAASFGAVVGARGRVVLPSQVRERLAVGEGDELVFRCEETGVRIVTLREIARRARGLFRGSSSVDEFLRERGEEASRE
jgi:AbrB family looped-hinge helix DNA binding protein